MRNKNRKNLLLFVKIDGCRLWQKMFLWYNQTKGFITLQQGQKAGEVATVEPIKCSLAGLEYQLYYKRVKRMNLRVRRDASVMVSVPYGTSQQEVERFMAQHLGWIIAAKQKQKQIQPADTLPSAEECMKLFQPISDAFYPQFSHVLPQPPQLVVKPMVSRWGVCYPAKKRITLASQLALQPRQAVEYVILHEYCHFIHPHHQPPFWKLVEEKMPDYKARRALLTLSHG